MEGGNRPKGVEGSQRPLTPPPAARKLHGGRCPPRPPGAAPMDSTEPVEVYSTFSPAEADIIANMLEAEGIAARASGEAQGSFTGATPEVTVMVHAKDADRA